MDRYILIDSSLKNKVYSKQNVVTFNEIYGTSLTDHFISGDIKSIFLDGNNLITNVLLLQNIYKKTNILPPKIYVYSEKSKNNEDLEFKIQKIMRIHEDESDELLLDVHILNEKDLGNFNFPSYSFIETNLNLSHYERNMIPKKAILYDPIISDRNSIKKDLDTFGIKILIANSYGEVYNLINKNPSLIIIPDFLKKESRNFIDFFKNYKKDYIKRFSKNGVIRQPHLAILTSKDFPMAKNTVLESHLLGEFSYLLQKPFCLNSEKIHGFINNLLKLDTILNNFPNPSKNDPPYVGLLIGPKGSGKTTLITYILNHIFSYGFINSPFETIISYKFLDEAHQNEPNKKRIIDHYFYDLKDWKDLKIFFHLIYERDGQPYGIGKVPDKLKNINLPLLENGKIYLIPARGINLKFWRNMIPDKYRFEFFIQPKNINSYYSHIEELYDKNMVSKLKKNENFFKKINLKSNQLIVPFSHYDLPLSYSFYSLWKATEPIILSFRNELRSSSLRYREWTLSDLSQFQ